MPDHDNLAVFTECVRNAPTSKEAEKFVRMMVGKFAKGCPIHILAQIGQCIIDGRRSELRSEAEQHHKIPRRLSITVNCSRKLCLNWRDSWVGPGDVEASLAILVDKYGWQWVEEEVDDDSDGAVPGSKVKIETLECDSCAAKRKK